MVANLEDETLGATLSDARAKALVTMLADAEAHDGNEKLGNTVGNVEAEAHFYTLARTQ